MLNEFPWTVKPEHAELMGYYEINYVKNAVLMELAKEVIQTLRKKYKIGMITNGRTLIQYGKLDHLGIREDFDSIIVSEEAGIKKPNAEIFKLAAKRLEVAPNQCI